MIVADDFVISRIVQCMIAAATDADQVVRRDAERWLTIWWDQWERYQAEDGR